MKFWTALVASLLLVVSMEAEAARRMGGGRSIGKQSGNVTQREAVRPSAPANTAPSNAAAPGTAPGAAPGAAAAPAAAQRPAGAAPSPAAQPAPSRPWAGILGGVAAGLGLAWLAHSLGLGAGFAQFLLFALVALVLMTVFMTVMRRRAAATASGSAYGQGDPGRAASAPQYNPSKIGNDASARPWESEPTYFEPSAPAPASSGGLRIGSGLAGGNWSIPAGFDAEGFVAAARRNFIVLQEAWDKGDIPTLRSMMTDEMVGEIRNQLAEREAHRGAGPNQTDVVMLEAQLLGVEDLGHGYMASVEFSGLIREEPSAGPSPFREVWNMTRTKDGEDGWLVAGVQALQ